jgi:8-oxo-dGTP diphosphatase
MEPRQVFRSYGIDEPTARENYRYCPRCGEALTQRNGGPVQPAGGLLQCPVCGFTAYRNPYPAVVVLVEKEGKVLLCKRSPGSFKPDAWCLPGGFIEYEEDFLSAGIREVREETGLAISIESILSVVSNFFSPKLHSLVIVLLGRVMGGNESAGDDAVSLQWAPLSGSMPDLAFEADGHIIRRYAETRLAGAPVDPRFSRPSAD